MLKDNLINEINTAAAAYLTAGTVQPLHYRGWQAYRQSGDRLGYEREYFERRRQLAVLGLSQQLAPTPAKKALLQEVLWAVCDEFAWGLPAHMPLTGSTYGAASATTIDLFAAETGEALAEIMHVLGSTLDPEIQQRVAEQIERRIFTPFEAHDWSWQHKANNWSAVIGGSLGMTALYLMPKASARQQAFLQRLDTAFDTYLGSFGDDGASVEGISYWAYGFGYYVYFAALYQAVLGDDRYLKRPKVQAIAGFPARTQLAPDQFVPFSDYTPLTLPSGLLGYCRRQFKVATPPISAAAHLDDDTCYRFAQLSRDLAWTPDSADEQPSLPAQTSYFANVQWLVVRNPEQKLAFAGRGGRNDESHNHLDVGNFVFGSDQTLFLTDVGGGEYTRDYFNDAKRYAYFVPSTQAHSVPLIDGVGQTPGAYGATAQQKGTTLKLDLTALYPQAPLSQLTRRLSLDVQARRLTITDDALFQAGRHTLTEQVITAVEPALAGHTVLLASGGQTCVLDFGAAAPHVVPVSYRDHDGKPAQAYRILADYGGADKQTATITAMLKEAHHDDHA